MNKKSFEELIRRLFLYASVIIIIIITILLLYYSKYVGEAVTASITSCLTIIIPSLFCFMAISGILIKSNIYILISKPFYPISKYIFRIPPELFSIFLLSNIGGYPIGAKLIGDLVKEEKITKKKADEMLCYCYCSGPAFILGTVGIKLFSSVLVGFIVYISILLSNCILAIILGLKNEIPKNKKEKTRIKMNSNIIIESVESSSKSILMICGMIVFFASIIAVAEKVGLISEIALMISQILPVSAEHSASLTKAFFEISKISELNKYCYSIIPAISCVISFGGLCVLMQTKSIAGKRISLKKFILTRPFQIALSGIISYFLIKTFAKEIVIMAILSPVVLRQTKESIIPALLIIIMTILLLCKKNTRFI